MKPSIPDRDNAREGKSSATPFAASAFLKRNLLCMQILINGKEKTSATNPLTIALALKEEKILNTEGIAVAVNETVIQRKEWGNFQLKDQDRLTIIKAVQGG